MKQHDDFPAYLICKDGSVTNQNTGRTLKTETTKNGYRRVTLCARGGTKRFLLHRLVASVFIANDENLPCVNHLDGDKSNNAASNLEWCSYSNNEQHSYDRLGKIAVSGESHYNFKLSDDDCAEIIMSRLGGESCRSIARRFAVSHQHVSEITRGIKRAG